MSVRSFFKKKLKKIGESTKTASFLGRLLYNYCYLIYKTNRFEYIGWPADRRENGNSFFVTFWHGHLMAPSFLGFRYQAFEKKRTKWYLLASLHRDGRIVAETARCFGGEVVDGSAKKGGVAAGLTIVRLMEKSSIVFMAPDGRKPGYKLTKGIIRLASQTGKPVYLCSFATSRGIRLDTWDRFFFPFPFGKGVVMLSDPFFIPADLENKAVAEWQARLETELLALTARAERHVGRTVPEFLEQKGEKDV